MGPSQSARLYTRTVDQHLLREHGTRIRVAGPAAAHGQVEDDEERVLEHPLVLHQLRLDSVIRDAGQCRAERAPSRPQPDLQNALLDAAPSWRDSVTWQAGLIAQ